MKKCEKCDHDAKSLAIQNYALMQDKVKLKNDLLELAKVAGKVRFERDRAVELLTEIYMQGRVTQVITQKMGELLHETGN